MPPLTGRHGGRGTALHWMRRAAMSVIARSTRRGPWPVLEASDDDAGGGQTRRPVDGRAGDSDRGGDGSVAVGAVLAQARRERGLTVEQVSASTKIRASVIRGIEAGDFSACHGDFYARGHIRALAEVVGADPVPLVAAYDEAHGGPPHTRGIDALAAAPVRFGGDGMPRWGRGMAIALVVSVAFGVLWLVAGGSGGEPVGPEVSSSRPPVTASASAGPTVSGAKRGQTAGPAVPGRVVVELTATRSSWVSARDSGGRALFTGVVAAGTTTRWTAGTRIVVIVGNAGGVRLTVNGVNVGVPGRPGEVKRLSYGPFDPAAPGGGGTAGR